jgi:Haem-binding domain
MKGWLRRGIVILIVGLIASQFVPVMRTNPPVEGKDPLPAELRPIVQRACFDCHSNETRWPWYSYIAPVSFLIVRDVREGRREVNFSVWDQYNQSRKARKLKEIVEQVETRKMPQWYYVLLHAEAKLSDGEREAIIKWAKQA